MRTSAPALLPIFRSEAQARILARLFERREVELSVRDLARDVGADDSTASREVERLAQHGMVSTRLVGRTKLVSANWSLPWARSLADLLAQTVGVPAALADALNSVAGIEAAYIFGSWAARHAGEPGPPPNDIDLVAVGDVAFDEVRSALTPLEQRLGLYVNPVVVAARRWARPGKDPFLATVQDRPLVPIPLTPRGS